jgi:hypothetical protein
MESLVNSCGAVDIKRIDIFDVSAGRHARSELIVGDCRNEGMMYGTAN